MDRGQARGKAAQSVAGSWVDSQPVKKPTWPDTESRRGLSGASVTTHTTVAEARIRVELDGDGRRQRGRGLADAFAQRVPEQGAPIGQMDGDAQLPA